MAKALRIWYGLGLPAALLILGSSSADGQSDAQEKTITVTIENMQFNPASLSVHRGDRIVWVNKDLFPHTVTAAGKLFDSGSIAAGVSWTLVASKNGEFSYQCAFHPTMKGSMSVQ
jgi:plastocyanin